MSSEWKEVPTCPQCETLMQGTWESCVCPKCGYRIQIMQDATEKRSQGIPGWLFIFNHGDGGNCGHIVRKRTRAKQMKVGWEGAER